MKATDNFMAEIIRVREERIRELCQNDTFMVRWIGMKLMEKQQ